jgi:phosphoribosylanthranilate isomerase
MSERRVRWTTATTELKFGKPLLPFMIVTTKVKICGLKDELTLEAALAGRADYVGFVFFAPSPRSLALAAARPLAARARRGGAQVVALLVDPNDALLEDVVNAVEPDILQLHGEESPARASQIGRRWARQVMKAIPVAAPGDAEAALRYAGAADLILFDAKAPTGATRPGGNGAAFPWGLLAEVQDKVAYMLSGGLSPDNVAEAIRATGAPIVDVSSGVECRPGEKDPALIARFLQIAKAPRQN